MPIAKYAVAAAAALCHALAPGASAQDTPGTAAAPSARSAASPLPVPPARPEPKSGPWRRQAESPKPGPGSNAAAPDPSQQPTQATYYGAGPNVPAATASYSTMQQPGQDGLAALPPLSPPPFKQAEAAVAPFTPDEIVKLRRALDGTRKAKAFRPLRTVPRISTATVDLSPGASPPIARMMPGEIATLVFIDMAGHPWPLAAAPRVSDSRSFDVEWLQDAASVLISPLSSYEDGNLVAMLAGLPTPVVVKLATGEPDTKASTRVIDYRLDLRVPGRAPGSPPASAGPERIALYDSTMQAFLDGLPPSEARAVKLQGEVPPRTKIWQYGGALFLRTELSIQSAFDQTMASSDGTRVYRLPPTPFVTLSSGPAALVLQLDID